MEEHVKNKVRMFSAIVNPVILVNIVKMVRFSFSLSYLMFNFLLVQHIFVVKAMVDSRMFSIVNMVDTSNVFIMVNVSVQKRKFDSSFHMMFSINLDDLNLPNGILFSRSCPTGLWFSSLNDRCDYPSVVQC